MSPIIWVLCENFFTNFCSMSYNRSYEEKYTIPNMSRSSMHRQRQHTNTSTAVKLPNLRSTEYIFQSTPAPTHSNTSLSHHFQQISQINLEKISDSDSTATSCKFYSTFPPCKHITTSCHSSSKLPLQPSESWTLADDRWHKWW